jgi:hypothetical protein
MEEESQGRQLNIHLDPENLAGVYANFANISFSDYEFTLTFARIDHEVEEGDIPGVVVSRVNVSARFMQELLEAMPPSKPDALERRRVRLEDDARPSRRIRVGQCRLRQLDRQALGRLRIVDRPQREPVRLALVAS